MVEQQSGRFRLKEVREVYSIVGECLAFGNDGLIWRKHLVKRLLETFGAAIGYFADSTVVSESPEQPARLRPDSIIDDGWTNKTDRQLFWDNVRHGPVEQNPLSTLVANASAGVKIARRCDLIDDAHWPQHPFYREQLRATGLNEFVIALHREPSGQVQILFLQRWHGEEPFAPRLGRLLLLLMVELRRHQPERLRPIKESAFIDLPKRLLQVLACLLVGHSAKETAELLELSVHTVQEHIRRLYERSGSSNRAELADHYRDIAPSLLALPLEKLPDYRDLLAKATRAPWPQIV